MSYKFMTNRPAKLSEVDLLGTKFKADAIKSFWEASSNQLGGKEQNKMIVLYGDWGSGKSSVLEYLRDELPKTQSFETVFFDTWENEKDSNLPLSLLYRIGEAVKGSEKKKFSKLAKSGLNLLKGVAKGVNFKVSVPGVEISANGKEIIEAVESSEVAVKSHSEHVKEFKADFLKIENVILGDDTDKRLVVFIDDLDRCEPENVLDLLSSIKLFFTYGERTIFLHALDKDAVQAAVNTRYKGMINSEEYLEKIFDLSFSMPTAIRTFHIVQEYFNTDQEGLDNCKDISNMFDEIGFDNARHIKKVLNKYDFIRGLKESGKLDEDYHKLIPNLLDRENRGDLLATVITLFLITLHEFYPDFLKQLYNFDAKFQYYSYNSKSYRELKASNAPDVLALAQRSMSFYRSIETTKLKDLVLQYKNNETSRKWYENSLELIVFFLPHNEKELDFGWQGLHFLTQFPSGDIRTKFAGYIIKNKTRIIKTTEDDYLLKSFFYMANTLF